MNGQLEIPGLEDAMTLLDKSDYLIKNHFTEALRKEFQREGILLFEDLNRQAFAGSSSFNIQLHLFDRGPDCMQYFEVGEETLWCHLVAGHKGPHYDRWLGVDWYQG